MKQPVDRAFDKIIRMLGPEKGQELIQSALDEVGVAELRTSNERLAFAQTLIARGGLVAAIGSSIKVQALMQGATEVVGGGD